MPEKDYREPWQDVYVSKKEPRRYKPPVGPGSKSVAPNGNWRDIDPALIPKQPSKCDIDLGIVALHDSIQA